VLATGSESFGAQDKACAREFKKETSLIPLQQMDNLKAMRKRSGTQPKFHHYCYKMAR